MSVSENLQAIEKQMAEAADFSARDVADVNLVAVSKKQPDARIQEALDAGHRQYGENRVQEAQTRWAHRRAQYPDLRLHLIGPLQSNKAKDAVALFDVIETLDREKLARVLADEMEKQGRQLPCFIQVNTGEEDQKAGIAPRDVADFYAYAHGECGLHIQGLMCIPPVDESPGVHFALLRKYAHALGLDDLSMGMSGDFEKAIALGATYIRVGTGVFGERDYDL
ncbi:MAG: YggS family pyridoxal phosphate-dependent enzyme [Alphaproteobacteria bacterium]|nr:YggS family pyridoxal phosphate-dependent enzyme [Alphaproteobacteria bacterium]